MPSGPMSLLREALENLAAEPVVQRQRLVGAVVTDELALDFAHAYEALASLLERNRPVSAQHELRILYTELSVSPDDPLWAEDLTSERWSRIRRIAACAIAQL